MADVLVCTVHHALGGRPLWIVSSIQNAADHQYVGALAGARMQRILGGFNGHITLDDEWNAYYSRANEIVIVCSFDSRVDGAEAQRCADSARAALIDLCGQRVADVTLVTLGRRGADVQLALRKCAMASGRLTASGSKVVDFSAQFISPEQPGDDRIAKEVRATNDVSAVHQDTAIEATLLRRSDALSESISALRLPGLSLPNESFCVTAVPPDTVFGRRKIGSGSAIFGLLPRFVARNPPLYSSAGPSTTVLAAEIETTNSSSAHGLSGGSKDVICGPSLDVGERIAAYEMRGDQASAMAINAEVLLQSHDLESGKDLAANSVEIIKELAPSDTVPALDTNNTSSLQSSENSSQNLQSSDKVFPDGDTESTVQFNSAHLLDSAAVDVSSPPITENSLPQLAEPATKPSATSSRSLRLSTTQVADSPRGATPAGHVGPCEVSQSESLTMFIKSENGRVEGCSVDGSLIIKAPEGWAIHASPTVMSDSSIACSATGDDSITCGLKLSSWAPLVKAEAQCGSSAEWVPILLPTQQGQVPHASLPMSRVPAGALTACNINIPFSLAPRSSEALLSQVATESSALSRTSDVLSVRYTVNPEFSVPPLIKIVPNYKLFFTTAPTGIASSAAPAHSAELQQHRFTDVMLRVLTHPSLAGHVSGAQFLVQLPAPPMPQQGVEAITSPPVYEAPQWKPVGQFNASKLQLLWKVLDGEQTSSDDNLPHSSKFLIAGHPAELKCRVPVAHGCTTSDVALLESSHWHPLQMKASVLLNGLVSNPIEASLTCAPQSADLGKGGQQNALEIVARPSHMRLQIVAKL